MSVRRGVVAVLIIAFALIGSAWMPTASAATPAATKRLTVSLTFDDGFATQFAAARTLRQAGYPASFFVNSGLLDRPGRLTWNQVKQMESWGNEIGGHTETHLSLLGAPKDEQLRQICGDRDALLKHGLSPKSFAYPYGSHDARSMSSVLQCGYNSGRITGGLTGGRPPELPAFSLSPKNGYALPALPSLISTTTAKTVETWLDAALAQGGWTMLVMHQMCSDCSAMAVTPEVLSAIVHWLDQHSDQVQVKTVGEMVGGTLNPSVKPPTADTHEAVLRNSRLGHAYSFDDVAEGVTQEGGNPDCWTVEKYGDVEATHERVFASDIRQWVQQISVRKRTTGDTKLIVTEDTGGCSPAVRSGHQYEVSARLQNTVPARFVVYLFQDGNWKFYKSSPWISPAKTWRSESWTTPSLPDKATRISFGVAIQKPGELNTTEYSLTRAPFHMPMWVFGLIGSLVVCMTLVLASPCARRRRARGQPLVATPDMK